jgi:hypothetical protein
MTTEKPDAATSAVMFWKQNDSTLYGRRHELIARHLARQPQIKKVLLVDAPISLQRLRLFKEESRPLTQSPWIYARSLERTFGQFDSEKLVFTNFIYDENALVSDCGSSAGQKLLTGYFDFLDELFFREGIDAKQSDFWFYPINYRAPALIKHFSPRRVITDIVDDQRTWPGTPKTQVDEMSRNYAEVLAASDIVLCNCEPVRRSFSPLFSNIHLIENGEDPHPPQAAGPNHPIYKEMLASQGQVIGYVGNLEAKMDIELLEKISRQIPDSLLVLIGSTHANQAILRLLKLPNVRMPGVVPYEEVGAWVKAFDVGIVPHKRSEQTAHMHPLKTYVYLRHGIPVVHTDLENIGMQHELMHRAKSHEEFVRLTRRYGLEKKTDLPTKRMIKNNGGFVKKIDEIVIGT